MTRHDTAMSRRLISSGSAFENVAGYSRAVVDGEWVFVSGCTGFDYRTMTISDDVVAQTHQSFANVKIALDQAGAELADVVRVRYYLRNAGDWERLAPIFGQYFASIRPAATALVCPLIDPRIGIEIEVTARKRTR